MIKPRVFYLLPLGLVVLAAIAFALLPIQTPSSAQTVDGTADGSGQSTSVTATQLTPFLETSGDVLLFDFEDPDEIGRFVYGNVNTFVEATSDVARTGTSSCAATFYAGPVREGKRLVFYTLMHPARGRVTNWTPYSEFQAAIYNQETFTVDLEIEYGDGTSSVWRRYSLPPQVWCRLRQPLSDLAEDGLDLSDIKRISWSQLDTDMEDINTLFIDDVRLIADDPPASREAVSEAWLAYEEWMMEEGTGPRAEYIPIIHADSDRISQIQDTYDCGHIDGYVVTDVLVVGGGMSGSSAAIASGRMGVETLVVEQYGFLGGTATAGMVQPFMSNRLGSRDLVRGIFEDIVDALMARSAARRDSYSPGVIYFDKEQLKYVLNDLVIGAGCRLMLHSWAERALVSNGECGGIIVDNKSGRLAILADVVVDATGDGDMAASAGCPYEIGRGYDQYTQSNTLFFRMGGVNESVAFPEQGRRLYRTADRIPANYMFADLFRAAVQDGRFPDDIPINSIYFERTMQSGVVSINATRVFETDATNVNDLTYASVETRRQAMFLSDFMVDNIPGFGNAYLIETGLQVGIRESRRILGRYQITGRDVLGGREFPDVIARGSYGIDIHCADFSGCGVVGLDLEEGESYDIPYRCLVPREIDNILLAGRCISATHVAFGSIRIMPVASGTGHAAGVAAALSVLGEVSPADVAYPDLHDALVSQGADL